MIRDTAVVVGKEEQLGVVHGWPMLLLSILATNLIVGVHFLFAESPKQGEIGSDRIDDGKQADEKS